MLTLVLLTSLLICQPTQRTKATVLDVEAGKQEPGNTPSNCSQPAAKQNPLIREAIRNQYWVRRVEFAGNAHTRDDVLRRRVSLREGDVFTRKNLVKSLRSVSELGIVYPVKLRDVIISLDRAEKVVDMTICLRERRPRRGAKRNAVKGAS